MPIGVIRSVMFKFEPKVLLKVADAVPKPVLKRVLSPELFASVKARLFVAETTAAERDELVERLIKIEKEAKGQASFILEILADVAANQFYARDRIEFSKLQKMNVDVKKDPSENGEDYEQFNSWGRDGFKRSEIKGSAVVGRKLLSTVCERLLDRDIKSPAEIASKVLEIISKRSSNKQAADPTKLEHFDRLHIKQDLEQLKNLSKKQPGEFSSFIYGKRKF